MDMQTTFYWGYDVIILFPWWRPSTALQFYTSCLSLFVLCLCSSKLKRICREIQRKSPKLRQPVALQSSGCCCCCSAALATTQSGSVASGASQAYSLGDGDTESWRGRRPLLQADVSHAQYGLDLGSWVETPERRHQSDGSTQKVASFKYATPRLFALWLLILLSVSIDWAMMLVCMTLNGGLFLAVISGVATGQLLVQHSNQRHLDCCPASTHGG